MKAVQPKTWDASASIKLHVYTLGGFSILVSGKPITDGSRFRTKPFELLKVLIALGGEAVAEERLTDVLWPDSDGDQAHQSFRTTLHRLRKLVGKESVIVRDGSLSLDSSVCWLDSHAFLSHQADVSQALESADHLGALKALQTGLRLYQGPFLDGTYDPPEILSAREKLHGMLLSNVEAVGTLLENSGNYVEAHDLYRRTLEADDLAEQIYQGLMRVCLKLDRYAEGRAAYQRFAQLLRANIASEPESATKELFHSMTSRLAQDTQAPEGYQEAGPPPAIAVLPFANMSDDPGQEYFSDGITEDLITNLSKISRLSVTARNTVFTYKGKAVNVQQVGRELNVNHVLEGSVRKAGERVRITAQLTDVSTGNHVWAERYDRELQDIFEVQDEITHYIVEALNVGLLDGEQARVWRQSTQNAEAYDVFLQGRHRWQSTRTREGMIQARRLYEQAVALDGNFAHALAALANLCLFEARHGWSQSPQASMSQGFELANRAIALDASLAYAWGIRAMYNLENREHDQALRDAERGVSLNPDGADVNTYLARAQYYAGKPQQALATSRKAVALAPTPTPLQLITLGLICLWSGSLEEARAALKKAVERVPDSLDTHVILAAAHAAQGQEKEAKRETQEVLRIEPDFNLMEWAPRLFPFKHEEDSERMMELLRKAGLPE